MSATPAAISLIILGMGIVTYGIRLSLIVLLGRITLRPLLQRALRFVPPAVLSAIIFPELLRSGGALSLSLANPRLWAGLLAALVVWRTRNVILAIGIGMGALWILQATIPH